jgi:hypothetical protein
MFPMSNWKLDRIGYYIAYMIMEVFSVTGINLLCAYIAASIPYANATFTVHYFFFLIMGGFYITDQFLFFRHPSVKIFFQWFSYCR